MLPVHAEQKETRKKKLRDVLQIFTAQPLDAYAAQSAFFIVLSFFPFLLLLLSVCRQLSITDSELTEDLLSLVPRGVTELMTFIFQEISQSTNITVISLSAVIALWSASRGVYVLLKGLNAVYGVKETRHPVWVRVLAMGYTIIFIVTLLITLLILVYGKMLAQLLARYVPKIGQTLLWILSFRSLGGILALTIIFLMLFLVLPNRRGYVHKELPGAFFAATAWIVFSAVYSYFTENADRIPTLYGSFATVILLLLWLYYCLYILLLGAMLNRLLFDAQKPDPPVPEEATEEQVQKCEKKRLFPARKHFTRRNAKGIIKK